MGYQLGLVIDNMIYIYNIHVHHPILGANHQVRKGPGDFVSQKRSLGKDHFKNGPGHPGYIYLVGGFIPFQKYESQLG